MARGAGHEKAKVSVPSTIIEHVFDSAGASVARLDQARAALAAAEKQVGMRLDQGKDGGGVWQAPRDRVQLYRCMASAMGPDRWGAVVAVKDIGWLAAAQCGVVLDRVLYVPDTQGLDVPVLSALIDSCGVVVVGDLRLGAAQARTLTARARSRDTAVFTLAPWVGAARLPHEKRQVG